MASDCTRKSLVGFLLCRESYASRLALPRGNRTFRVRHALSPYFAELHDHLTEFFPVIGDVAIENVVAIPTGSR